MTKEKMIDVIKEYNQNHCDCNTISDCEQCSKIALDSYESQIRADAIDEVVGNIIEEIEEIKKWYEEKHKEINDVQICIVLEDLNNLINELKENNNEIN